MGRGDWRERVREHPQLLIEPHSNLGAILASWAVNVASYYDAVAAVEPKRGVLHRYITQLEAAERRLEAAVESLEQSRARRARLSNDVDDSEAQWRRALDEADRGGLRLELADRLLATLRVEVSFHFCYFFL